MRYRMNLFTRSLSISPDDPLGGIAAAIELGQHVSKVLDIDVPTWTTLFGGPQGVITWSARTESMATHGANMAKLDADAGMQALVAKSQGKLVGPILDTMAQFVAVAGEPKTDGKFAAVVTAQVARGQMAAGMGWAVDILNHVAASTGTGGSLARNIYGPSGTLSWIAQFDSFEELDAYHAAQSADVDFVQKLDESGSLFTPGSGFRFLLQRLA
jgi:hypothetical protein